MSNRPTRPRTLLLIAALAGVSAGCDEPTEAPLEPSFDLVGHGESEIAFEVYTQNMYLGGDTGPLFTLGDFSDLPVVASAVNVFWAQVLASDVPARASAIVDEIALEMPHLVALQEVLQFVLLDADFNPIGGLDLLAAVEAAIAARTLPYETALVQATTSSALPLELDPAVGVSRWLAFTDRLVTLRRTDVEVVESAQALYAERIQLGPFELRRGWTRATVDFRGVPHHFVNTHLETQATPLIQANQAAELRGAVLAGLEGVTVLAGDLNSNAAASAPDPTWTPTYGDLVTDGFIDVWATAPRPTGDPGLTCCHDQSLLGDSEFNQRIDFVLVRSSAEGPIDPSVARGWFSAAIVGEEPADRTDGGLWPSDHAGLKASLRLRGAIGG